MDVGRCPGRPIELSNRAAALLLAAAAARSVPLLRASIGVSACADNEDHDTHGKQQQQIRSSPGAQIEQRRQAPPHNQQSVQDVCRRRCMHRSPVQQAAASSASLSFSTPAGPSPVGLGGVVNGRACFSISVNLGVCVCGLWSVPPTFWAVSGTPPHHRGRCACLEKAARRKTKATKPTKGHRINRSNQTKSIEEESKSNRSRRQNKVCVWMRVCCLVALTHIYIFGRHKAAPNISHDGRPMPMPSIIKTKIQAACLFGLLVTLFNPMHVST
jgi:hypothetical protein